MQSCSVANCTGEFKGLGFCNRHYQYFKAHGVPFKSALDRFWEKVDVRGADECWLWTAHCSKKGYGRFGFGGRVETASRWLLGELRGSPLRWDSEVHEEACHTCDHPPCVNPAHLVVGTPSFNNQDAHNKGRHWTPRSRTHCRNGHSYDEANTYIHTTTGERVCKTCIRENQRRYRQRKRAKRAQESPKG